MQMQMHMMRPHGIPTGGHVPGAPGLRPGVGLPFGLFETGQPPPPPAGPPPPPPAGRPLGFPFGAINSSLVGPAMPPVPTVPLPSMTKIIVTVPLRLRVDDGKSLGDLRMMLLKKGFLVKDGAWHARGDPEALDDDQAIKDLPDTRLVFNLETDLQPWRMCLAHRISQQLLAARGFGPAGALPAAPGMPMTFEAVAARHPLYKTKLCNGWGAQQVAGAARCVRGARCVYAHGPGELRPRPQVTGPLMGGMLRPFLHPQGMMFGGAMRPPAMPGQSPPGTVSAPGTVMPGSTEPVAAPAAPEVVFTVDPEEERRRAERARRFAARPASFEQAAAADAGDAPASTAANAAGAGAGGAGETGVEGPGADGADGAAASSLEDRIADYIMDIEQQFLSSWMPEGDDLAPDAAAAICDLQLPPGPEAEKSEGAAKLGEAQEPEVAKEQETDERPREVRRQAEELDGAKAPAGARTAEGAEEQDGPEAGKPDGAEAPAGVQMAEGAEKQERPEAASSSPVREET